MQLQLTINGKPHAVEVDPNALLLDVLRNLGYSGVKYGCREGSCGTCTVLVDGEAIYSCITLAGQVEGRAIVTIEGLGSTDQPHPLQRAFVDEGAVQCGFCMPGMLLSSKSLLDKTPNPSRAEITGALDGNLCRCTGYEKIFRGVEAAAKKMRGES